MTGYVIADKPEMKVREFELYNSYYCGVCKSIAARYGQLPRMLLSYDSAFLALLLAGLSPEREQVIPGHCIVHPVKKKFICVDNPAVDHAADILLILAYAKLEDDVRDEGKLSARALRMFLKGAYRKLRERYPELTKEIEGELNRLSELEKSGSDSLDETCAVFGRIMAAAFSAFPDAEENDREVLRQLGSALGRWLYLTDAWDDIGENIRDGNYNPVLLRYGFDGETETEEEFRERTREAVRFLLFFHLGEMSRAYDLLNIRKNKGITDNVLYFGLHRKTDEVLKKGIKEEDERSL